MKASAKFLFRLFLYTQAAYGVLVGLLVLVPVILWEERDVLIIAVVSIFGGSLFQVFLYLLMGGWHILAVRRRGFHLTDEALGVRQERALTLELPYDAIFRLCLDAIRALERTEVLEETDYDAGKILARKKAPCLVQQNIRIWLRRQESRTTIVVQSCPPMPLTLLDFGYSLRNVDGIVVFLLGNSGEGLPGWTGGGFQDSKLPTTFGSCEQQFDPAAC